MSNKLNAKRVTITLAEETLAYVDDTAKKIGTSRSAMLAFMAETYRKQDEATKALSQVQELKMLVDSMQNDSKA